MPPRNRPSHIPRTEPVTHTKIEDETEKLRQCVISSRETPSVEAEAEACLARLNALYQKSPDLFTEEDVRFLNVLRRRSAPGSRPTRLAARTPGSPSRRGSSSTTAGGARRRSTSGSPRPARSARPRRSSRWSARSARRAAARRPATSWSDRFRCGPPARGRPQPPTLQFSHSPVRPQTGRPSLPNPVCLSAHLTDNAVIARTAGSGDRPARPGGRPPRPF